MAAPDLTRRIRRHYDLLAPFYLLWGRHVHHGYWADSADRARPAAAQERLLPEPYALAGRPARIVTPHVARGWDVTTRLRDKPPMRAAARALGTDARAFAASFTALRRAYAEGAVANGLLAARKPGPDAP